MIEDEVIKVLLRKLFNFILVASVLTLLSGCGKVDQVPHSSFITINGESCSLEEYEVYFREAQRNFEEIGGLDIWETDFDGRSAVEVAKESALNAMIAVKVTAQKAEDFNITLTQEEQQQALEGAQSSLEADEDTISQAYKDAVQEIMEEKRLYTKVRAYIVKDYVISEPEFKNYSESYYDAVAAQMKEFTIKSILCYEEETANQLYDRISEGEDFETVYEEWNETGENYVFSAKQSDLEGELSELMDAPTGYISRPIEMENVYGIFKVVHIEEGSEEDIKEKLREDYTSTMQEQIFSSEMEKWISASAISKDESVWKEIDIGS